MENECDILILFIGDFNTPTKKEKRKEYDAFIHKGLIDCARTEDILKPTYSHSEEINYFTADYCFATDYTPPPVLQDLPGSKYSLKVI